MAPSNSIPVGKGGDTRGKETNSFLERKTELVLRSMVPVPITTGVQRHFLLPHFYFSSRDFNLQKGASLPFWVLTWLARESMATRCVEWWSIIKPPKQDRLNSSWRGPTLKSGSELPIHFPGKPQAVEHPQLWSAGCLWQGGIEDGGQAWLLCSLHWWSSRKDNMHAHHTAWSSQYTPHRKGCWKSQEAEQLTEGLKESRARMGTCPED